jgi:hypothetical protein
MKMQLRTTKKQKKRDFDIGYESPNQNNKKVQYSKNHNEKENHSSEEVKYILINIFI